jgi:hypothetical protein
MITIDGLLKQLSDIEDEMFIKPRKEVALHLGCDAEQVESITASTVIVVSGHYREGLPNFIRFSPLLEKNTFIVMKEPNTF